METVLLQIVWILLIGAVCGFLATWLGIGGCFLRIPMMMVLLGLTVKCQDIDDPSLTVKSVRTSMTREIF